MPEAKDCRLALVKFVGASISMGAFGGNAAVAGAGLVLALATESAMAEMASRIMARRAAISASGGQKTSGRALLRQIAPGRRGPAKL